MTKDYPELDLCHPGDQSAEYAIEQALACERHGLALDDRIINSDGAHYGSHTGFRVYGNSHGFLGGYLQSRHNLSCVKLVNCSLLLAIKTEWIMARKPTHSTSPDETEFADVPAKVNANAKLKPYKKWALSSST